MFPTKHDVCISDCDAVSPTAIHGRWEMDKLFWYMSVLPNERDTSDGLIDFAENLVS